MTLILSKNDFSKIKQLVANVAGIVIDESKHQIIANKITKNMDRLGIKEADNLDQYLDHIIFFDGGYDNGELQKLIDCITVNETYFFREKVHFDFLQQYINQQKFKQNFFRIWSAACSSGEEAYSVAMCMAETLPLNRWEVVASDLNNDMLHIAKQGFYNMEQIAYISENLLKKYCLKGVREAQGFFMVSQMLKSNLEFKQINLFTEIPKDLGEFDMIFLRNTLMYFEEHNIEIIIKKVLKHLKKSGFLILGSSENFNCLTKMLNKIQPTIYQYVDL